MKVKRMFDLFVSIILTLILSPLMLLIAVTIILSDGSPIIFKQLRVGKDGREFFIYKFRTMSVDKDAENGRFDVGSLTRITRIGKFLRKSKLDELPQLYNVIIGDMSLVGPRPEVRRWVDQYPGRWRLVHTVYPGITDPASLLYKDEEQILASSDDAESMYRNVVLPEKLTIYENYIRNRSFSGDLKIILNTFFALFNK